MNNNVTKKITIGLIVVVLLIAGGFQFFLNNEKKGGGTDPVATLTGNGKEVLTVHLATKEDGIISLETYKLPGKLEVKNHKIRFIEVDCPDKLCEKSGFIGSNSDTAVCLPNKMALKISS